MEVNQAKPETSTEPKIRFKKGKTAEGASAHFKENPYTFIAPDDPIIKACMSVCHSFLSSYRSLTPADTGTHTARTST